MLRWGDIGRTREQVQQLNLTQVTEGNGTCKVWDMSPDAVASAIADCIQRSGGGPGQEQRKRKPLWMNESALIIAKKKGDEVPSR